MTDRINVLASVVMGHPNRHVRSALQDALILSDRCPIGAARQYLAAVVAWSNSTGTRVDPSKALQVAGRIAERCSDVVQRETNANPYLRHFPPRPGLNLKESEDARS